MSFNSTCILTKCSEKLVQMILHEYSILALTNSEPLQWKMMKRQIRWRFRREQNFGWIPILFLTRAPEIFHAEVLFREDATADEFIDVIQGNRMYVPCLYVSTASSGTTTDWPLRFIVIFRKNRNTRWRDACRHKFSSTVSGLQQD